MCCKTVIMLCPKNSFLFNCLMQIRRMLFKSMNWPSPFRWTPWQVGFMLSPIWFLTFPVAVKPSPIVLQQLQPIGFLTSPTGKRPSPTRFLSWQVGFMLHPVKFLTLLTQIFTTPIGKKPWPIRFFTSPVRIWPSPIGFLRWPVGFLLHPVRFWLSPLRRSLHQSGKRVFLIGLSASTNWDKAITWRVFASTQLVLGIPNLVRAFTRLVSWESE